MPAMLVRFTVRLLHLCTFMPALQLNSFSNGGHDYAAENVEIFFRLQRRYWLLFGETERVRVTWILRCTRREMYPE